MNFSLILFLLVLFTGFFYVLDRATGELLSAEKFGKVTWAEKIDLTTGRPVEAPGVRYEKEQVVMWPSSFGAHNWHSMSFNPQTGLMYIPYQEVPGVYRNEGAAFKKIDGLNTGTGFSDTHEIPREAVSGALLAWDPVRQREAWRVPHSFYWNGGTLSTAGNLVFQGTADGNARVSGQWHYRAEQSEQQESLERSGRFDLTRPLSQDGYPELVPRLDAAWQAVAQQIADALR